MSENTESLLTLLWLLGMVDFNCDLLRCFYSSVEVRSEKHHSLSFGTVPQLLSRSDIFLPFFIFKNFNIVISWNLTWNVRSMWTEDAYFPFKKNDKIFLNRYHFSHCVLRNIDQSVKFISLALGKSRCRRLGQVEFWCC